MTGLTDSLDTITQALIDKIKAINPATLPQPIGTVFYGDQERLPDPIDVCVDPDRIAGDYAGARRLIVLDWRVFTITYANIMQTGPANAQLVQQEAEAIGRVLNNDRSLGGIVLDCKVTSSENGYMRKANQVVRANRMTVEGKTQALLP